MSSQALTQWLHARLGAGEPAAAVEIVEARGSTPRDGDALMLVSADAIAGTIGGGTLEYMAIEAARDWLAGKGTADALALPLGPLIGQCCGGHVSLRFKAADAAYCVGLAAREAAQQQERPPCLVFGAGHVGRALALALAPLPFATRVLDSRLEAIAALEAHLGGEHALHPEHVIASLPARSACVIMTHSHTLDFIIGEAALLRGDLAYAGMIGSATKRAHFRSWLVQRGHPPGLIDPLVLPIGGAALRDKRPEIIAALTAAEILIRLLANPAGAA